MTEKDDDDDGDDICIADGDGEKCKMTLTKMLVKFMITERRGASEATAAASPPPSQKSRALITTTTIMIVRRYHPQYYCWQHQRDCYDATGDNDGDSHASAKIMYDNTKSSNNKNIKNAKQPQQR